MARIYAMFWGKDAKDWKDVARRLGEFRNNNPPAAIVPLADFTELFMFSDFPTSATQFLSKYDAFVARNPNFSGLPVLRFGHAMALFYHGNLAQAKTEFEN